MNPARVAQANEALEMANEVRTARAILKRRMSTGALTIEELLYYADADVLRTWRVSDILRALPRVGPSRSAALMREAAIGDRTTAGRLTARQRDALIEVVEERVRQP